MPLGIVNIKVTYGDAVNYRHEILSFKVVHFEDSYHTVMGRPCFVKFMAVPNYTYLNMKMPSPHGVITVENVVCNLDPDERELNYEIMPG